MDNIVEPTSDYEFSQLMCISPTSLGSGNYFIRLLQKSGQKPLYIQPPKCSTKQGILKSGKKMYTDLLFKHEDEPFHEFLESLETFCKNQLFHYREKWFDSSLTEDVIEESFLPVSKMYKSGKFHCIRAQIPTRLGKSSLKVFDEEEQEVSLESINNTSSILTIVEVQGIRCSARSFQLDLEIKQMMLLKPEDLFETCLFSKKSPKPSSAHPAAISTVIKSTEPIQDPVVNETPVEESLEPLEPVAVLEDNQDENKVIVEDASSIDEPEAEVEAEAIQDNDNDNVLDLDNINTSSTVNPDQEEQHPMMNSSPAKQNTLAILEENVDEVDLTVPDDDNQEVFTLKRRNDVYFNMYKEAKRKAKIARDLAISSYLEAKQIRHNYLANQDVSDSSSSDEDDEDNDDKDANDNADENPNSLDKEIAALKSLKIKK
jgi:hypothetical protein